MENTRHDDDDHELHNTTFYRKFQTLILSPWDRKSQQILQNFFHLQHSAIEMEHQYISTVELDFQNHQDKNQLDFKNQITNDQLGRISFKNRQEQLDFKNQNGSDQKCF